MLPLLRKPQAQQDKQRPTPDIRQGETAECGLAALAILLAHHGSAVTLEDLRRQAGSTRLGLSARQIIALARQNGFHAAAYRRTLDELQRQALPVIAHSRFIHFVVVESVTDSHVMVNDPGCGPVLTNRHDFAQEYTGIIITVQPLKRSGPAPAIGRQTALAGLLRPMTARMAIAMAAGMMLQGLVLIAAITLDKMGQPLSQPPFLFLLLLLAIAGAGAAFLRHLARQSAANALARTVEQQASAFLTTQDLDWFSRRVPDQAADLMLLAPGARAAGLSFARTADMPGLLLLAAGASCFGMAGLAVAFTGLAAALLTWLATSRRGSQLSRMEATLDRIASSAPAIPGSSMLAQIETWLCGGRSEELALRLAGSHAVSMGVAQRAGLKMAWLQALQGLLHFSGMAAVALHGLGGAKADGAQAGGILGLALLCAALHRQAGQIACLAPALSALRSIAARLEDIRNGAKLCEPGSGPPPAECRLALQLQNQTITLSPGETLAVTGPSGCGKSRLLRAIAGLEPLSGVDILLNGKPAGEALAQWPGLVLYEARPLPPFEGTVAQNLRLGQDELSDDILISALEKVELWQTLAPRGGLALPLTPARPSLSGGQLRRLMLARSLLRQPRFLVVDEAFDALENELEIRLRQRLTAAGIGLVLCGARAMTAGQVTHEVRLGSDHEG